MGFASLEHLFVAGSLVCCVRCCGEHSCSRSPEALAFGLARRSSHCLGKACVVDWPRREAAGLVEKQESMSFHIASHRILDSRQHVQSPAD